MSKASFRQLVVWQRSIDLTLAIYKLTKAFPRDEQFGLSAQMRRAAVSIASNIAEGQARSTPGEFKQFLGIANGSLAELQTQLIIARSLALATDPLIDLCDRLAVDVSKMLAALIATLVKPAKT